MASKRSLPLAAYAGTYRDGWYGDIEIALADGYPDGTIDQARMRAVSPSTDFSFDFQDLLLRPVK